jgi:multisubunit Na+/H+ antiporter MnhB subunit
MRRGGLRDAQTFQHFKQSRHHERKTRAPGCTDGLAWPWALVVVGLHALVLVFAVLARACATPLTSWFLACGAALGGGHLVDLLYIFAVRPYPSRYRTTPAS